MSQPQTTAQTASITLDDVFKALQHWRDNKTQYEGSGIPDEVWHKIFQLEKAGYKAAHLKRLFSLNTMQYRKKQEQSTQTHSETPVESSSSGSVEVEQKNAVQFGEAVVVHEETQDVPPLTQAANQTKSAISQLKATSDRMDSYLDTTTVIVECIRDDGHRLKIHTTSERLDIVMRTFFNREVVV